MLSGVLHRHDRSDSSTHRVVNLSATGARMSGVEGLAIGEIVAVTIGLVENALAEIVRSDAKGTAIRFLEPIDVARARTRRTSGTAAAPSAGWLGDMQNAYRR